MTKKKDEPIIIDITPEPSPEPEGLQKIMMKYTKLVMKRLYGTDNIYVFFCDGIRNWNSIELRAIFRQSDYHSRRELPATMCTKWGYGK